MSFLRALQEERLHIQKKTFTKWMNSFLLKAKMEVDNLFTDSRKLIRLLDHLRQETLKIKLRQNESSQVQHTE